jgi:hypothetical protein
VTLSPLQIVVDALEQRSGRVRRVGDQVDAQCPAHHDQSPSLSVRYDRTGGRVLVNCHTGCAPDDVVAALGLTWSDLFDPKPEQDRARRPEIVATYDYADEHGQVVYQKLRYFPKDFRVRRPDGRGQWTWKIADAPRVLYRLPEVRAAVAAGKAVVVVEGEKDADRVAEQIGMVATCNYEGAAKDGQRPKWRREYSEQLRGANVLVVADNDEAGHAHARAVAAALHGVAAAVRVFRPAVDEAKADMTDHLDAGLGLEDLVPLDEPAVEQQVPIRRLKITRASDVVMRRIRWLWTLRIVLGGLTLLAGREGIGKSTVAAWLCAAVTRGELDGELHGQPRAVVYVNSEDARDYTIVPRLRAAGADLDQVIFVDAVMPGDDGRDYESSLVLPADAHLLADIVAEHHAVLVVLDAATSTIDSRLDGDRDRQMRQGLEAIGRDIGEKTGSAVLGIVHFGKRDSSDTGKLILGSIAWSQVARSVLAVALDEENGSLVVSRTKGNLGLEPPSLAAQIVSERVLTEEGDTFVGRMEWLGETDRDARTLLAAVELDQEDRTERDSAAEWLEDFLTPTPVDAREKVPSKDVKKAARDAGFSERTLARARASLAVKVISEGFPRESFWSLPSDASPASDATPSVGARRGGTTRPDGTTGPDLQLCNADGSCSPQSCQSCHPHVHGTTDGATADEDPTTEQWRISGRPA